MAITSELQEAIDCAIRTAGIDANCNRIEAAAAVEEALNPSQRCELFRLLGATVETLVVIKRGAPGHWVTVSDLAKRLRVSKQSASKRIERLESVGVLQTRSGPRGTKLVNLAQFDQAAGELADAVRQLGGSSGKVDEGRADVLCFVPETGAWACGGRSGNGLVAAIAALFSVDQARAITLICEALGRGLIRAGSETKAGEDRKSNGQVGHLIETRHRTRSERIRQLGVGIVLAAFRLVRANRAFPFWGAPIKREKPPANSAQHHA